MYAVVAVYPLGHRALVGFAHSQADVNGLIDDCISCNGEENLKQMGVWFSVELAC